MTSAAKIAPWYYVREVAESSGGKSSLLICEYYTQEPPAAVGTHRELQAPEFSNSGYWVTSITEVTAEEVAEYDDIEIRVGGVS